MSTSDKAKSAKEHWEHIYGTKKDNEVSWTQDTPETSLRFIEALALPHQAEIIDIGAGNSNLAAKLLDMGYRHLSVLDISGEALERTRQKLEDRAARVRWIESNILDFSPTRGYDLWHDRATFHFLTSEEDIRKYVEIVTMGIKPGGHLLISTFSTTGPKKCSGLDITQYSEASINALFSGPFQLVHCSGDTHTTPFDTTQEFLFALFKRLETF